MVIAFKCPHVTGSTGSILGHISWKMNKMIKCKSLYIHYSVTAQIFQSEMPQQSVGDVLYIYMTITEKVNKVRVEKQ